MNKKLLISTLALIGGLAHAQTSVSIYGIVDVGLKRVDNGDKITTSVDSGVQSASRIGFKGEEVINPDLSVNFVLENGFNADTGANSQGSDIFGRLAWVGLESKSYGSLRGGLQYTPLRNVIEIVDPFEISLSGNSVKNLNYGKYTERVKNSVSYTSPEYAGLKARLFYGAGETAGDGSDNRTLGAGVYYKRDALSLQGAYHELNSTVNPTKDYLAGAVYNFGKFKTHAAYGERKTKVTAISQDETAQTYLLGVNVPFGVHTVMASYVHNELKEVAQSETNIFSVGYAFNLSKRTNLYTAYSYYDNKDAVAFNSAAPGLDGNQLSAGIRHKF